MQPYPRSTMLYIWPGKGSDTTYDRSAPSTPQSWARGYDADLGCTLMYRTLLPRMKVSPARSNINLNLATERGTAPIT